MFAKPTTSAWWTAANPRINRQKPRGTWGGTATGPLPGGAFGCNQLGKICRIALGIVSYHDYI